MPFIAHSRKATTDLVGELLAEFARPLSYSFVADDDTPSGQQFLHHAQTEWEAEIQPHGMADDLGREPVPAVSLRRSGRHPSRLLTPASPRKRGNPAKLTVPSEGYFTTTFSAEPFPCGSFCTPASSTAALVSQANEMGGAANNCRLRSSDRCRPSRWPAGRQVESAGR